MNKLLILLFSNPLSVMRFALTLLLAKVIYSQLNVIYQLPNNHVPSDAKTWILHLMPDSWLVFDPEARFLLVFLIFCTCGAAFGIAGRLCLILMAGLEFLVGGAFDALGFYGHNAALTSQVLLILALVPGSMRISVDYFLYNFFGSEKIHENRKRHTPKWGFNLILVLLVLTYLSAGISKLRHGGMEWLDGATLGFYLQNYVADYPEGSKQLLIANDGKAAADLWKDNIGFEGHTYGNYQNRPHFIAFAKWVATKPVLVIGLSVMTVLFEFCGFIVFFNSKYRNIYLISAFIAHTMIGVLMGLYFHHYRLICLGLLDWKLILNTFGGSYGKRIALNIETW